MVDGEKMMSHGAIKEGAMYDQRWLKSFIANALGWTTGRMLEEAEWALEKFKERGSEIQSNWGGGCLLDGPRSKRIWNELSCLAWAFCKASQLYRLRMIEEFGADIEPDRLPEYQLLTAEFARYAQSLHEEAAQASAAIPAKQWSRIDGVRARANIRSQQTAAMAADVNKTRALIQRISECHVEF